MIAGIAPFLAGLGLFFCGIHFIAANLTSLAGRKARAVLTRLATTRAQAALVGIVAGILTQSTNAVTYIVIGLVGSRIIDKRRAILIPVWSHVGAAVLVIFVAIDFRIAASYLVALAGFAIYFGINRDDRARQWINILLGIGLLFLGVEMLKSSAGPLREWLFAEGFVQFAANLPPLLLVMGAALTMLCQSSTVAGAIAVAAANIDVIDFSGACWIVYGANLGSAANYLLLAKSLGGEARQIVLIQVVQKLAGFIGIVLMLAVGWTLATPLAQEMTQPLAGTTAGQVALVFLAYQVLGSLACTLLFRQVTHWLERIAPPTELEELSRPAFLIHEALVEPSFALDLVDREEVRLMERLPTMLDSVRADGEAAATPPATLRSAGLVVGRAMASYLEQILDCDPNRAERERVVRLQHRTANLAALYEALDEFVTAGGDARKWPSSGRVADQMVEALHMLLAALGDAVKSEDAAERDFVMSLLRNRDELMERIRRRVLNEDPDMPAEAQSALFAATTLFERIVWLARQNTTLLSTAGAKSNAAVGQGS
jgi:phosphate:Na+ symporter